MYFFPAGDARSHRSSLGSPRGGPGGPGPCSGRPPTRPWPPWPPTASRPPTAPWPPLALQRGHLCGHGLQPINPANHDSAVVHVVEAVELGLVEAELDEEVDTLLLLHIATYATIDGALTSSCRYRRGRVFQRRPSVKLYTKLNIYQIRFEIDVKAVF